MRFILYLLRWQLSTPVLWVVIHICGASLAATVLANMIGGGLFYFIDRYLFTYKEGRT